MIAAALLLAASIGSIEFFGYKGLDVAKVLAGLPVREGGPYREEDEALIRKAAGATDVAAPCCDERGNRMMYIGLPGASYKNFAYNPEPEGDARLPAELLDLCDRIGKAIYAAVRKGGDAVAEDDSNGYALIHDPDVRSLQLELRRQALRHEQRLFPVLESSSDAGDRQAAAEALGYARQSRRQVLALVRAARDPDDTVRNNATRALGVLVRANPALARQIPAAPFIEMLNSGIWTDRNKSVALLMEMTVPRDPTLFAALRAGAFDSLVEMARWRTGHAIAARMILGRLGGIPEERLLELLLNGPAQTIIDAATRSLP